MSTVVYQFDHKAEHYGLPQPAKTAINTHVKGKATQDRWKARREANTARPSNQRG
ncbi:hypothetical protein JG068_02 [Burkholderia phage JG068]|uniref:Uncharacterized protein n=1 Tax=Burkholderia phage JG068 TaxID=1401297 RepID=U3PFM7_9CAUD|nr:hypothetical protein JG068_02 [Burkholderia phage JG068]AGW43584.1 hypothetical protein JG068_02 [Burkholderia phage JG068]